MENTISQCPKCHQWFTNIRSLRIHILSCQPKHSVEEQGRAPFQHHPLKSSFYHGGKMMKGHLVTILQTVMLTLSIQGTDQMMILLNHNRQIMIISMAIIITSKDKKALQCQRCKSSLTI
jgi:hypothetical protein